MTLVPDICRVHPVIRQSALEDAALVHEGAEVVEIHQAVLGAIVLEPPIQRRDSIPWTPRKRFLRIVRVIVHRENRRKHHPDAVRAGQLGRGRVVGVNVVEDGGVQSCKT
jgi:hypothetical protein